MKNLILLILSFPKTVIFNFYYLPFRQAIYLPIWLYNVKVKRLKGRVLIECVDIKPGMIKLGLTINSLYEINKSRFVWENKGIICFKGTCIIGHNSAISTGKNGYLEFGNNFSATTTLRLACYKSIIIGENTRMAWEIILMDTDFHETINIETGERSIPIKEILIGKNNWIGIRSVILKGTVTPDFCIVGAHSLLNKKIDAPSYSLIAGNPAKFIRTGLYRDLNSYVE